MIHSAYDRPLSFYDEETDIAYVQGRPIVGSDFTNADLAHMLRAGANACQDAGFDWGEVLACAADALDHT